jgi:integrase
MPRPKSDGTPARLARRRSLTELFTRRAKPEAAAYNVWDTYQRGLVLRIQPTGHRAWKCVYTCGGRPRWLHIGDARAIGLADARLLAAEAMPRVARGGDPAADRAADRSRGTFAELATDYVEQYAKRKNKSWKQADALVRKHLLPRWGKLKAQVITRRDVKAMVASIEAPVVTNQVLAHASAIFTWAIKQEIISINPCRGVDRNETRDRERVLSDSEIPSFWSAFEDAGLVRGAALKVILLTGQRPGEVSHMRWEHIKDGWWEMPGAPVPELRWPGTKNAGSHRIWLPGAARAIIAELADEGVTAGFVFAGPRGKAVGKLAAAMQAICARLGLARATPHDLRRSFLTAVTRLGFGRNLMDRIANHKESNKVTDIYDRHAYADETKRAVEAVASHVMALAEGETSPTNVVRFK